MRVSTLGRDLLQGAAAGVAAAFVMNCFQIAWGKASKALSSDGNDDQSSSKSGEPSTVKAVDKFQGMVSGRPLPDDERRVAGNLLHYGFGGVVGAIYAVASRHFPLMRESYGTAYSAAVWIVADETLVPAAGLSPPPTKAPASSHLYSFISHLVFGAALEGSLRIVERETES